MLEETSSQVSELSLRDYMDLLRRRKAIVIQTFMVVFVLGVAITFMAKPVYRTSARILVEGRSFNITNYDTNNPLSQIFSPDTGHDIATQIEVLQGDKVLSDAFRDADVPPGSARLDVHQVNTTDVIELVVESNTPTYAERLAKALPNTYLNYVTGNRRTEIDNAFTFASNRYKEENDKLLQAELALQRFKEHSGITDADSDRNARLAAIGNAENAVIVAQQQIVSKTALLDYMQNSLKTTPKTVKTPVTTNNPAIPSMDAQVAILKQQRASESVLSGAKNL